MHPPGRRRCRTALRAGRHGGTPPGPVLAPVLAPAAALRPRCVRLPPGRPRRRPRAAVPGLLPRPGARRVRRGRGPGPAGARGTGGDGHRRGAPRCPGADASGDPRMVTSAPPRRLRRRERNEVASRSCAFGAGPLGPGLACRLGLSAAAAVRRPCRTCRGPTGRRRWRRRPRAAAPGSASTGRDAPGITSAQASPSVWFPDRPLPTPWRRTVPNRSDRTPSMPRGRRAVQRTMRSGSRWARSPVPNMSATRSTDSTAGEPSRSMKCAARRRSRPAARRRRRGARCRRARGRAG